MSKTDTAPRANPFSLVGLATEPRHFDPAALRAAVGAADVRRIPHQQGGESFLLACEGMFLVVHNHPSPYFEESWIASIPDRRMRRPLERHRAWYSLDWLYPESANETEVYARMAPALAAIGIEDTVALYLPHKKEFHWITPETRSLLVARPLSEWFEQTLPEPIFDSPDDDPEMDAAIAEARRRWPEFVAAYQPGKFCCVKATFRDGDASECMWLTVTDLLEETVTGRLQNDPFEISYVRQGSIVTLAQADVVDWFYARNGKLVGAFTQKLLAARHGDQAR